MSKKKVLVTGSRGRMGQEILSSLKENSHLELGYELDRQTHKACFPPHLDVDVVIDFSSLELFREGLSWSVQNGVPFVSGTTGLCDQDYRDLASAARSIPVLWSANMSLGVNVLLELLGKMGALSAYDFQVEEFHHNKKLDKPSGTAVMIQDKLEKTLGRKVPEPLSGRGGGIFGIHKVWVMAEEELLVFEHTALNRRIFARGAISCASWLLNQKAGLYGVSDMLGLRETAGK
jgi:4-hydroxy-tetrahydrodipicolinate reductase